MFQTKVVEKITTHILGSVFFFKSYRLWDNVEKFCRLEQAIGKHGVCVMHAGYLRLQTHSGCVTLTAFPLQQWLHERTSLLPYTYTDCLFSGIYSAYNKRRVYFIFFIIIDLGSCTNMCHPKIARVESVLSAILCRFFLKTLVMISVRTQ
jgi:hypothetical protein